MANVCNMDLDVWMISIFSHFLGSLEMQYWTRDSMRHARSLPGLRYLFHSAEQVLERLGHRRVAAGLANGAIPDTGRSNRDLKKTFSVAPCTLCTRAFCKPS